jgi:hypothetical protein
MPSAVFELAIPATKRPKTYILDRVANGIGINYIYRSQNNTLWVNIQGDSYRTKPCIWICFKPNRVTSHHVLDATTVLRQAQLDAALHVIRGASLI